MSKKFSKSRVIIFSIILLILIGIYGLLHEKFEKIKKFNFFNNTCKSNNLPSQSPEQSFFEQLNYF